MNPIRRAVPAIRRVALAALLCFAPYFAEAQHFTHISTADGLSQHTVMSVVQDTQGCMWFGTLDGLNRYDGYEFEVFRHVADQPHSIANNYIRKVALDCRGHIWAATKSGLSVYNPATQLFTNIPSESPVADFVEIDEGVIMVCTEGGLRFYDVEQESFVDDVLTSAVSPMRVASLLREGDIVWLGTPDKGLFTYSIGSGEVMRSSLLPSRRSVQQMLFDPQGRLWVATEGDGLYCLDVRQKRVVSHFRHGEGISSNFVRTLALDTEGRLWIGTYGGLDIYDGGTITSLHSDPFEKGSLSQNSIRSIYCDNQGGMWLGTYFGGINYHHPMANYFTHIERTADGKSLNSNFISCIVEDGDGSLWIGTNSGGVNHYNPTTKRVRHYLTDLDPMEGVESNDIKAIYVDDRRGEVYVGAHAGGLHILDKQTGRVRYRSLPGSERLDIYAILPKDERTLWIGTLDGLMEFDIHTQRFVHPRVVGADAESRPLERLSIRCLFLDSEGNLWVGGENGLRVYSVEAESVLVERRNAAVEASPRIDFVNGLCENSQRMVWIATSNGLYCYTPILNTLRHLTTADGLPSNTINGVEEDSNGRLWVSTTNGLSLFNPYMGSFRNYTTEDGLPGNQFNTSSHCYSSRGVMYFGGFNGITAFVPESLRDNPYTPAPMLTALYLLDYKVAPNDESKVLSCALSHTRRIDLRHDNNTFALHFSVPNYLSGQHNSFSWILEGYDKEWSTPSDIRSVSYANVPSGAYVFKVRVANNNGKWSPEVASVEVRIHPAWWQTVWAKVLFGLIVVGIALLVFKFVLERKTIENRLRLEQQESAHKEELHQMKQRFFINISHEFRTPLTLIINPLSEMIGRAGDGWMRKQLKYVERNAKRLLHLINQLMDYRRAELGVFKLRIAQTNVHRVVAENFAYYENLAHTKKIKYTLHSEVEGERLLVDEQYLELIINNLLSNAFNYTTSGAVSVEVAVRGEQLVLKVSDTGVGIAADQQSRIFERFYQAGSDHIGSGVGLSLVQRLVELHHGRVELESTPGEGSTFTVILPQRVDAYSTEELAVPEPQEPRAHTSNTHEMYLIGGEAVAENSTEEVESGRHGTILIAEDEDDIRDYLREGLGRNFTVLLAKDGKEALALLAANTVDLVLTDTMMPVMDGLKLCAQIKQNVKTSHLPVIMISAKSDLGDQLNAFGAGADDYLVKPFAMPVLEAKVRNTLRTHHRLHDKVSGSLAIVPEQVCFNALDEQILTKAVEVVRANIDNPKFSTDEFARAMNMSRSNLHLKLKTLTGESALDFVHKVRFEEACKLLRDGRWSISEISDKVGFSTPSYFATSFKKYMGCLPTEYQNRHTEQQDKA